MANPKITVVIPTLNRAQTLSAALRTVTMQDYENLSIIVSDNCSDDETRELVYSFDDPRIVYIRPERRLSMSHHWEFALSHVNEGWVTILGDDDGLLPGAIRTVARLINEYNIPFISSLHCKYIWPYYKGNKYGKITSPTPHKNLKIIHTDKPCMSLVKIDDIWNSLPILYTGGFADTNLIKKITERYGRFYHSQIPDIFTGFLFYAILDKYIFLEFPLGLAGRSKFSNAVAMEKIYKGEHDKNSTKIRDNFFSDKSIPVHPDIPAVKDVGMPMIGPTINYESLLQVVDLGLFPSECRDHEEMARIVLAFINSCNHEETRKRTSNWLNEFVRLHNLDLKNIQATTSRNSLPHQVVNIVRKIFLKRNKMRITGSKNMPLQDVHEASLVVGKKIQSFLK